MTYCERKIHSCGTVRPNRKDMPSDFGPKKLKLTKGDILVARYNRHIGYVDISDLMANSYSMCRRTFKWTMKLFFHLLDLTVLNSWILLYSRGAKCTHKDFRLLLVRNLKKPLSPHPQYAWSAKCGCSKCYEAGQLP